MIVGIIGNGFVGKATKLLNCSLIEQLFVYDILPEKCEPSGLTFVDMTKCDLIFVALPTPMQRDGSCHTGIIDKCLKDLKKIINPEKTHIILRSTVPPGTSDHFDVNFMPEFLTERNWAHDFINCQDWIFGTNGDPVLEMKIRALFKVAHQENVLKSNNLHFIPRKEAELIKYVKNCFLAVKVSFFNEIAEYAELKGIDFETVRHLSTLDDRIGQGHSKVPGPDGKKGFGGTCFPKDTNSLLHEMRKEGMESYIIKSAVERNETVDRPESDWKNDKGRAVI